MKNNKTLGIVLSIVGIFTGLLLLFLLADIYQANIDGKIAGERPDEAITVQIVFALLSWIGVSAGALWVMVLYGFQKNQPWAWFYGVVASSIQLLAGFFPIIPPSSIGLPAPTMGVFLLAAVRWFGMLFIGGIDKKVIAFAFVSGLAFVLTFIDGVGAISRYQTEEKGFIASMYMMSQSINWLGAAVWAMFIFGLVRGKQWSMPVGIFAAAMSMFGGYPVGLTDVIIQGRASMFLVAPIMSTVLLVALLLPGTPKMLKLEK